MCDNSYNIYMYLKSDYTQTYIIKRSEFIVILRRIKNEEEYKTFVSEIRKKHKRCQSLL